MLVFRIWSHLQLLKRAGSIHRSDDDEPASDDNMPMSDDNQSTSNDESIFDGSAAIVCPACPQPGKNTFDFPEPEMYE